MLKNELKTERTLYREIFLKAKKEFSAMVDMHKNQFQCKNCDCFQLIYFDKKPQEILESAKNEANGFFWEDVSKAFVPYGYENCNDWNCIEFDSNANKLSAANVDREYVAKVLNFEPNAVFYKAKLKDNENKSIVPASFAAYPFSIITLLKKDCAFKAWQDKVLDFINNELAGQVNAQVNKILEYKKNYSCQKTGTCCKLASSEYNYQQLLDKAKNGDNFAAQFTSIFKPYESIKAARKVYPDFVDFVVGEIGNEEEVNFYYCPHLTEDNLCSIYDSDKRPKICDDFPDNPLTIIYPVCGYYCWKKEVQPSALLCHAMLEIADFTAQKIEQVKALQDA